MFHKSWIFYAVLNLFVTSFGITNFKYLTRFSPNIMVTLAQCLVITGVFCFIYLLFNQKKVLALNKNNDMFRLALHMGLFLVFTITSRYLFLKSIEISPNIGYSHLIVNLNVIITFILSYLLFNQTINKYTFGGIILCLIGLYIIIQHS